jgi:hypothetical protein
MIPRNAGETMSTNRRKGKPVPKPELPWSWHKGQGWTGQLDKMCRWIDRIRRSRDSYDVQDFLFAYFIDCFHLREWLLLEKVVKDAAISSLFKANVELRLAQDLANALKHGSLNDPKQPREFSMAREYAGPDRGWFESDSNLVVLSDGIKYDLLELAHRCLKLWVEFLRSSGRTIMVKDPAFAALLQ